MSQVSLGGNPVNVGGEFPAKGSKAPSFTLTAGDLSAVSSESLAGQRIILNIFPSIDTAVCAASVRTFNARAGTEPVGITRTVLPSRSVAMRG